MPASERLTFVSLIWHPWSLDRFDPEMRMLELTFEHARRLGLKPTTYAGLCDRLREGGVPPAQDREKEGPS